MNLGKLLSENLRRFGVKNLIEQTKVSSAIYGTPAGTYTLQQMSGIINTYNPTKGYIQISDGNTWLANQRAKSLSNFFSRNVEKILSVPYDSKLVKIKKAEVLGAGDENQYVKGTLYAILEKSGKPVEQFKYSLLYRFYEVDGKPHIVVTKRGMGHPQKLNNRSVTAYANKFANKFIPNAPKSKLIWQQDPVAVGSLGIMIPLPSGYAKKDGSRLYFNTAEELAAMRKFIATYTEGKDSISRDGSTSNWTPTTAGSGNYIFGNNADGRTVVNLPITGYVTKTDSQGGNKRYSHPELTVDPEATKIAGPDGNVFVNPETVVIRRTYRDKSGGDATIAGTGTKAETRKIGDFKFDKTMFPDNMIRVKNTPELQVVLENIKKAYDNVRSANPNFKIKSVSSIVEGYASSDNATNRTNSGKADHDWGINWPSEKWITK
tara:strand:- start:568 stop:1869 length:1302 start_codon:yes stop_codon:yes gene_type:complete